MPGSCDSDQSSSSSSLISSLRQYRFQNKSKQTVVSRSSGNSSQSSSSSGSTNTSSRPISSQKSQSSAYNPLGYRKYDSSSDTQTLLQNISAKIQTLFKCNKTGIPTLDLKLTIPENNQFKDIVLRSSALSVKWSSCVTETSTSNPNEKLYKIKKSYLCELSNHICTAFNNKIANNHTVCITPEKTPIRTYSRAKPVQNTNLHNLSNSVAYSGGHNPGAMDDYEEFCEKEQSLRKLLDAFPGADIMEAQDILVKCQWDLNKALQEAQSQPLRTTRKRGFPGSGPFMVQTAVPSNIPNQVNQNMSNSQQSPSNQFPEEIVLDSSDEEDVNGIHSKKVTNDRSNPVDQPPSKKARRLISTSSSEDEVAGSRSPTPAAYEKHQQIPASLQQKSESFFTQSSVSAVQQKPVSVTQQKTGSVTQQKTGSVAQQKTGSVAQQKTGSVAQQKTGSVAQQKTGSVAQQKTSSVAQQKTGSVTHPKPTPTAQQKSATTTQPIDTQLPNTQNGSAVDKSINIPQGLSLKPVSAPTPSNNEQPSTSTSMPNLPKGLVITQVGGGADNASKTTDKNLSGASVNGNHPNIIPSNSKGSAQLVRIKASTSVDSTSATTVPCGISVNSALSCTPISKAVSITPVGTSISMTPVNSPVSMTPVNSSISMTPVNQATSVVSAPKTLSITPVVCDNDASSREKSSLSSSTEEDSNAEIPKIKRRIKNIDTLLESEDVSIKKSVVKAKSEKKGKSKGSKSDPKTGKRKRFEYEEEDEDEDYGNEDIYDSEDSDYGGENLTPAHSAVLKFFQEATAEELGSIPGCSKKKMELVQNLRPFTSWIDLVAKLKSDKTLSTDLLNGAKKVIDMRNAISKLMTKCQRISLDMEDLVEDLKETRETSSDYVSKQPELLNERMHLTAYQMLGLNWLLLMHNQQVNGILADEMGLGKTVQAISFLAYLKQIEEPGPHLIVVPSSTLDNWKKELETWWPTVSLICYHGMQESRRELRMQILNDEVDEFDVMITTYNMVTSSAEDRSFFKRLEFNYVVFDEAHMLKNMSSQRYVNLMRIKAPRRLLLTGTPLQNNLVELMSLLIFAMPHMFSGKTEQIKQMFSCVSKSDGSKTSYEKDRIDHAKRIMKPFVLRRLKKDVLKELPIKQEETRFCPMFEGQAEKYNDLVKRFSAEVQTKSKEEKDVSSSGAGMMMQLRRAANHPLLLRRFFDDNMLLAMAKKMIKEPTHSQSDPNMIFEDMSIMSDFELHKLCKQYKSIKSYALPESSILNSGKFKVLDELLPELIKEDHRILLFSQFTMVLDIVQEYMNIKQYKYLRLDGQVPVSDRQQLIDDFNNDPEILVFLLSTRAGGLGINLTAADTVILHDIDFNPYNDKQAEDRCHRVGQVRDVKVFRFISENTIEEGILQRAKEKLKLERDIHEEETEENDTASVAMLLRDALGLNKSNKS